MLPNLIVELRYRYLELGDKILSLRKTCVDIADEQDLERSDHHSWPFIRGLIHVLAQACQRLLGGRTASGPIESNMPVFRWRLCELTEEPIQTRFGALSLLGCT